MPTTGQECMLFPENVNDHVKKRWGKYYAPFANLQRYMNSSWTPEYIPRV